MCAVRYLVRSPDGEELVVPSLSDLHGLYSQGFLEDEDLVRAESSTRWVPAGRMATLAGVRLRRREPRRFTIVVAAAIALVALLAMLLLR